MKCSSACPWYTETGKVRGFNGPLKTHCRMTMHPWQIDCDQFNPNNIETIEVTEEQWQAMLAAVKKKAKKQRKLYPEEHEWPLFPRQVGDLSPSADARGKDHADGDSYPGDEYKGKWNAKKSGEVIVRHYDKKENL